MHACKQYKFPYGQIKLNWIEFNLMKWNTKYLNSEIHLTSFMSVVSYMWSVFINLLICILLTLKDICYKYKEKITAILAVSKSDWYAS